VIFSTSKVEEKELIVVDKLELKEIKTKEMVKVLNNLNVSKALVVMGDKDVVIEKSAANVPDVKTTQATLLNVYDILKYDTVITTKAAVEKIEEVYA
jgi:large subunit ribosomal protein L4